MTTLNNAASSCHAIAGSTSGDDPAILHKHYSHIYSSSKNSSKRSRAAYQASIADDDNTYPRTHKKRRFRANKKMKRLATILNNVTPPPSSSKISPDLCKNHTHVFDGSHCASTSTLTPPPPGAYIATKVQQFHIPDSPPQSGLEFKHPSDPTSPLFIKAPRSLSLSFTGLHSPEFSQSLCSSFLAALDHTKTSNTRGNSRKTFTHNNVANLGSQPNRSKPGCTTTYHKAAMDPLHWDTIVGYMVSAEKLFCNLMHPKVIAHAIHAQKTTRYPLVLPTSGIARDGTSMFSAINIARNAYLRAHTDQDFYYSIMSAFLLDHQYTNSDEVICYFVFPTLGVAVPIRPGDHLIFSPQIPHCISSRCNPNQTVIATSMYLKTAVVGLYDNSIQLTEQQQMLAAAYDSSTTIK